MAWTSLFWPRSGCLTTCRPMRMLVRSWIGCAASRRRPPPPSSRMASRRRQTRCGSASSASCTGPAGCPTTWSTSSSIDGRQAAGAGESAASGALVPWEMPVFKHILLATDGSAASQPAERLALQLAGQHGANLTAVYVIDPYPYLGLGDTNPMGLQAYLSA